MAPLTINLGAWNLQAYPARVGHDAHSCLGRFKHRHLAGAAAIQRGLASRSNATAKWQRRSYRAGCRGPWTQEATMKLAPFSSSRSKA